ncbi:MAG: tRNA lysidine(34) synthetase TilS [Planctomycetota bacterium]|nr:tRNA lysidine(34) synthetase TilS [Planctomycetota bacterium]
MTNRGKSTKEPAHASGPFASTRWAALAGAVGIAADAPVAIALSGGADSVYLMHVVASALPRPRVLAVHVDHRLRGEESERDARFAARLCDELNVPFRRVEAALADGADLEARAREVRYAALRQVALEADIGIIATGHHSDDALETLLQRLVRGTSIAGLAGLERRLTSTAAMTSRPGGRSAPAREIVVVRPLIALRREEVRIGLSAAGHAWIEDSSNAGSRFTRNRIRHGLLPQLEEIAGKSAVSNLRAFGTAIEELEGHCAALTADIHWSPPAHADSRRGAAQILPGGTLARARLACLPRALVSRALWRLLTEGVGAAPAQKTLARIVDDITQGRTGFHALPRDYSLQLRSAELWLEGPAQLPSGAKSVAARSKHAHELPFEELVHRGHAVLPLAVPGRVTLHDGRTIESSIFEVGARAPISRSSLVVELDRDLVESPLHVRFSQTGDRFFGLGAPGSKALSKFLADAGVPRGSRACVPLVVAGSEIVWVAGIRPAARVSVTERTTCRLMLALVSKESATGPPGGPSKAPKLPFDER